MLKVAFASTDRTRVNQHFGAAEGFVVYEVTPDKATLVGVAEFAEEAMDGNEDKLGAKVDFLAGCAAVYVMAIGAESKVEVRPVSTGGMAGGDFVVSSGLKAGDQVIVNGIQKAPPGTVVKPVPWNPSAAPASESPKAPSPATKKEG